MNRFIVSLLFALSFLTTVSATQFARRSPLFGIQRGGGLFGGKDDDVAAASTDAAGTETVTSGDKKMYDAMTKEEIEDWLEHVPVFAVTDSNGAGVVLKPDDNSSVFYFFLNPLAANATMAQLKSVDDKLDLRVSAFSLGKIWFNLIDNGGENREVLLKKIGEETSNKTETTKGVEYRLVPDSKDLLGARMLLTMSPEDGEKLKSGEPMTQEMAQKAVEKAMKESPKFKETYNEIPVFTIAQMRMQKQPAEGEKDEKPVTLLPMYFSMQNMVGTWQQFVSQSTDLKGVEPAINLMSLHELIEMMQKESEIDFRSVVLIPNIPEDSTTSDGGPTIADPMANNMGGGATLGDL